MAGQTTYTMDQGPLLVIVGTLIGLLAIQLIIKNDYLQALFL